MGGGGLHLLSDRRERPPCGGLRVPIARVSLRFIYWLIISELCVMRPLCKLRVGGGDGSGRKLRVRRHWVRIWVWGRRSVKADESGSLGLGRERATADESGSLGLDQERAAADERGHYWVWTRSGRSSENEKSLSTSPSACTVENSHHTGTTSAMGRREWQGWPNDPQGHDDPDALVVAEYPPDPESPESPESPEALEGPGDPEGSECSGSVSERRRTMAVRVSTE